MRPSCTVDTGAKWSGGRGGPLAPATGYPDDGGMRSIEYDAGGGGGAG